MAITAAVNSYGTNPDYASTVNAKPGLLGAAAANSTPMVGSTASNAGGVGDFFGGGGGMSSAISGAGDKYQKYMQQALAELQSHETQGRGDLQQYLSQALGYMTPYSQAGQTGLQSYMASMGLLGGGAQQAAYDKFTTSPGYKFALNQGLTSVQRGMQARGLGGSGAEAKQLQMTGQGLANQEYGQYQQRLAGLAGMGQQAAGTMGGYAYGTGGQLAQLGLGYAGQQANVYTSIAQAEAEEEMAKEEAKEQSRSSLFGGLGSLAGGIISKLKNPITI
jgi:hypothetical protein